MNVNRGMGGDVGEHTEIELVEPLCQDASAKGGIVPEAGRNTPAPAAGGTHDPHEFSLWHLRADLVQGLGQACLPAIVCSIRFTLTGSGFGTKAGVWRSTWTIWCFRQPERYTFQEASRAQDSPANDETDLFRSCFLLHGATVKLPAWHKLAVLVRNAARP